MKWPSTAGIPSAPGYVPKYESNERFSWTIITTWRILWIPTSDERTEANSGAGACGAAAAR